MRRLFAALAAASLMAAPALASDWRVDREASTVEFETTVFGGTTSGVFEEFDAEITLDPQNLSNARIDAVVRTGSGHMPNDDYQAALTGGQGLAPGDHPEARFVSEDIRTVNGGYEAHGTLTVKGVAVDLVLPFTLNIEGDRAVAEGAFTVSRETFNIGGSGWGDVGSEVEVILHIEADRVGDGPAIAG